jgi:hypothetical protein
LLGRHEQSEGEGVEVSQRRLKSCAVVWPGWKPRLPSLKAARSKVNPFDEAGFGDDEASAQCSVTVGL